MHERKPIFPLENLSRQTAEFVSSTHHLFMLNFILCFNLPTLTPYLPKNNLIEIQRS